MDGLLEKIYQTVLDFHLMGKQKKSIYRIGGCWSVVDDIYHFSSKFIEIRLNTTKIPKIQNTKRNEN